MAETKVKKNKKTEDKPAEPVSKYAAILTAPRVTEKANVLMQKNVYVFEIPITSGKREVIKAVKDMYKVTPVRVNTVSGNKKSFVIRGKRGSKMSTKKAYVYLKEGDKIELFEGGGA